MVGIFHFPPLYFKLEFCVLWEFISIERALSLESDGTALATQDDPVISLRVFIQ